MKRRERTQVPEGNFSAEAARPPAPGRLTAQLTGTVP